jgi:hypothetical protein
VLVKSNDAPVVNIISPRKIAAGTALSFSFIRCSADVRGTFSLAPAAGTIMPLGTQTVTVSFSPAKNIFRSVQTDLILQVVPSVPEGTLWIFNDTTDRLRPLCGHDVLTWYDPSASNWPATKISFASASSLGLPLPPGGDPQVMRFAHSLPTEGLRIELNDPANGTYRRNGWVSNYTIIFDLLYPTASRAARKPLFNANKANSNGPEALITNTVPNAVEVAGNSYGEIKPDTWHRRRPRRPAAQG